MRLRMPASVPLPLLCWRKISRAWRRDRQRWVGLLLAICTSILALLITKIFTFYTTRPPFVFLILAVAVSAQFCGARAGTLTALLTFAGAAYSLIPPQDLFRLALQYFAVALVLILFTRLHRSEERHASLARQAETQRQRLDFALEAADMGEWEMDLTTRQTVRSPQHDRLFGHATPLPEWTLQTFLDHVLPESRAAVERNILALFVDIDTFHDEVPIRWPDGTKHWLEIRGHASQSADGTRNLIGVVMDITARKQTELALQEREQQLQIILNLLPVGVLLADVDGRIVHANPAACQLAEDCDRPDWRSIRWRRAGADENFAPSEDALTLAARYGTVTRNEEFEIEARDGSSKTVLNSALPILDKQGNRNGAVAVSVDITGRKNAERALLRNEKLASAGLMIATLAHEINNPLEAATNAVYLASSAAEIADGTRSTLAIAEDELARIAHLTRQTLAFFRETTPPAPFRLRDTVGNAARMLSSKLAKFNVQLEQDYRESSAVLGLEGEVRQIISNLLRNAIEASPPDSRIRIRTADLHTLHAGQTLVRLTVADTGVGISTAQRKKIFEPFFTTKPNVGTGLGLWIIKELIVRQNATLHMKSLPGRGTVFTVYFRAA